MEISNGCVRLRLPESNQFKGALVVPRSLRGSVLCGIDCCLRRIEFWDLQFDLSRANVSATSTLAAFAVFGQFGMSTEA